MQFRKKPVVIEAVNWTGKNMGELFAFMNAGEIEEDFLSSEIKIKTLEGVITASKGDWIIKGVKGEFYPCKPDIFEATYEKVD